jgi:hypothetical protein
MNDRISSSTAARLIGIKTSTLAKWRWLRKGPRGWIRMSPTYVTYARRDVETFLAERVVGACREREGGGARMKRLPGFDYDARRRPANPALRVARCTRASTV